MTNRAAYMSEIRTMELKEIPMPTPKDNEVVVRIDCCGICGSDVHFYLDGRIGKNKDGKIGNVHTDGEFALGHETAGTVYQVGPAVTSLKVGDRVAIEPGYACGQCEFCKQGKYNLCTKMTFFADPPVQGCMMNYVAYPADWCFKLPDNVSTREGALVEPLAVGLHACKQGGVTLGDSVVILGAGCIGLVTLLSAKAFGASNVIVIDLFEKRLEFAKKLGANHVINAREVDSTAKVREILGDRMADVVIECCGATKTIQQTVYLAKRGGTIVQVGMPVDKDVTINYLEIMNKELCIQSVFRYRNLYPTAIAAISDGTIDVDQIVTHEFKFEDCKKAYDTVVEDAQNVVKGVIIF